MPSRSSISAPNLDFLGLEIDAIAVDGQPASFTRHSGELTIDPATPLPAGARFTTEIAYHGRPIGQDAPTVGTLLGDISAPSWAGAEQKPGPEEASSTAPDGGGA